MKKQLITTALAIITVAAVHAQNTFPPVGNVGIGTGSPAASLQVIGTSRLGGAVNYAQFDLNGNLSFVGASTTRIAGNKYVFQYSGNGNYGLFFNTTKSQYEFRNSAALPVFSVNWLTGNGVLNGSLKVGAYTLPATDGVNGQVLKTNGAGALAWAADNNSSSSPGWLLNGNSGTDTATDFIGTTDAQPLVFKVNNIRAGFIDADELRGNTSWGQYSLLSPENGDNSAFGCRALFSDAFGHHNTAVGSHSLFSNTTGSLNTATGSYSLSANTTGINNSAFGFEALTSNTTGSYNTAIGLDALWVSSTGGDNTAIGSFTLRGNTTGNGNTATGGNSLYANTTGSYNTANGGSTLFNNSMGFYNTATGYHALSGNSTGNGNTATGNYSLYANTTGGYNTANGDSSLANNTTAYYNTATGYKALLKNSTGTGNTAVGTSALLSNLTGQWNVAVGYSAGNNYNGNYNTIVGSFANITANNISNSVAIGYNATVDGSNRIHIGSNSINSISGQVNWTIYSDERVKRDVKETVPGLKFINALRPVCYHYDIAKENELIGIKNDTAKWEGKDDLEKINFSGLLAQEVDAAAKKINYDFSGVDKTGKVMGLRYADFVPSLVKAVQELSQQVDQLNEKIAKMGSENTTSKVSSTTGNDAITGIFLSDARLDQNLPNPFAQTTSISYNIPNGTKMALLVITDATGKEIKKEQIENRGNGRIVIDASSLSAGNYFYTLYIDGKNFGTKKMTHGGL